MTLLELQPFILEGWSSGVGRRAFAADAVVTQSLRQKIDEFAALIPYIIPSQLFARCWLKQKEGIPTNRGVAV